MSEDQLKGEMDKRIVFWIQIALAAYGLAYIWNSSFELGGQRCFTLFDDAMVSMRYASNFSRGLGLVWNPGEAPVEGFSNGIWTLMMAACQKLPLRLPITCAAVQL